MAGEEEARAHDVLAEMQLRISQGPESALGLGDAFSPEDVRAAFLALTKQFHPARFGRLSPELRAMSTEVFLGIKSAHEQLLKILGVATKSTGSARATGGMPPLNADGTSRTAVPRSTGSVPRPVSGTSPPLTQLARGTDRSAPARPGAPRTSTPASGVPVSSASQSGNVPRVSESQAMPRVSISSGRGPVLPTPNAPPTRQPTPAPGQTSPLAPQGARPPTLQPGQTSPLARQGTPAPGQTSPLAPARPGTLQPGQTSPLARQGTPAPGQTSPIARQGTPAPGQTSPLAPQGARPPTLQPGQTSPLARQGTPAPGTRSPLAPPSSTDFNPPTQRGFQSGAVPAAGRAPQNPPSPSSTNFNVATQRGLAPTPAQPTQAIPRSAAPVFDETTALNESLMFLEHRNWGAARQALHALAAKVPQSKQYRALLCYARGREAHAAGRGEEALLEYQRALQLDPDLTQVKQAVAELQRRR